MAPRWPTTRPLTSSDQLLIHMLTGAATALDVLYSHFQKLYSLFFIIISVINIIYIVSVDIMHSKHKAEVQSLAFVPFVPAEKIIGKWNESGKTFVDPVSVHLALGSQMSCKLYSRVQLLWLVSRLLRYCKSYPALQTTPTGHFRSLILPPFVFADSANPPTASTRVAADRWERRGWRRRTERCLEQTPVQLSEKKEKKKKEEALFFLSAGDTWLHTRELAVYETSKSVPISCGTCSSLRACRSLTQDEICFHMSGKLAQYRVLKRQFIWLTWALGMFLPSPLVRLSAD